MTRPKFLIILSIRFLFFSQSANSIDDEYCPQIPCLEEKPHLLSTEDLTIKMYYHEDGTNVSYDLWLEVCKLVQEFGGLVKLDLKAGAKAKKVNGALTCGVRCSGDQWQACLGLIDSSYFFSCTEPNVRQSDMEYCMEYNKSDFIIVYDGQERKQVGIPECQIPTLTFNDKYDPCVPLWNYEELKQYVCKLYNFDVPPCNS